MKIVYVLEYIFRNQRNNSEFAHFFLFVFLLLLFFTYMHGVKEVTFAA